MSIRTEVAPPIADVIAPVASLMDDTDRFIRRSLEADDGYVRRLTRHLERYHGKRLRPALLHLSAMAADAHADHFDTRVKVAGVIELIHVTTLVHDDVIDGASMRRRVATINARWDNETAVILGDYLFASAWKTLTRLQDLRPLAILSAAVSQMCEGELLQISRRRDFALSEEKYLDIVGKKTGELFRAAAYLGALLVGQSGEKAEQLGEFGYDLGIAFQIADDWLDVVGSEERMGKSLGTDLEKGHLTLPLIHWLEQGGNADRLSRMDLSEPEARREMARLLERTGSLDYARESARRRVDTALARLQILDDTPARRSLSLLGDYVIARSM